MKQKEKRRQTDVRKGVTQSFRNEHDLGRSSQLHFYTYCAKVWVNSTSSITVCCIVKCCCFIRVLVFLNCKVVYGQQVAMYFSILQKILFLT